MKSSKLNSPYGIFLSRLAAGGRSQVSISRPDIAKTERNKQLIRDGFNKWAGKTGNFFDLLADDVQWTIAGNAPFSKTYASKKQFLAEVIDPLNQRLSARIVPQVKELYADGDMVIAIWDGKATATDGHPYNGTYEWNMQIKGGKIVRVIAFLDEIEFSDILWRIRI
jgi:ketosteroid isomerase-like protein